MSAAPNALVAQLGYDPDAHLNSKCFAEARRAPGFKQLKEKLLAVARGRVIPHPEHHMDDLLARGAVVTGKIRKRKSEPNACHYNSAMRWLKDPRATIYVGYYYHDWRRDWLQHTWNVLDGDILDMDDDAKFYFGVTPADQEMTAINDFFGRWIDDSPDTIRRAISARLQERVTDVLDSMYHRIDWDAAEDGDAAAQDFADGVMNMFVWWDKVRKAQGPDIYKPIDMNTLFEPEHATNGAGGAA